VIAATNNWSSPDVVPPAFEEDDPERLRDFIRRYPLGTLVTTTANGLDANWGREPAIAFS